MLEHIANLCFNLYARTPKKKYIGFPKKVWVSCIVSTSGLEVHQTCFMLQNMSEGAATVHWCLQQCISFPNIASGSVTVHQCLQHSISVWSSASVSATGHLCL